MKKLLGSLLIIIVAIVRGICTELVFLRRVLHNFAMILLDVAIIIFCAGFLFNVLVG